MTGVWSPSSTAGLSPVPMAGRLSPHSRRWRWCIRLMRYRGSSGEGNLLQLSDLQRFEDHLFIEGFADPLFHLADEVFLKGDLGEVDPFPLFRPGDVPRRVLRHGDKGDPGVS